MSLRIWCKRRQQRPLHMVITRNASIQSQGFSRCHNASLIFALAFFFSSRRRHTMYIGDWSSDVCSSDLFSRKGYFAIEKSAVSEDRLMEIALEAGADDLQTDAPEVFEVVTSPDNFENVRKALEKIGRASCRERV